MGNATSRQSEHICNILGLMQCLALDSETNLPFLRSGAHIHLYGFLAISGQARHFERIRVTALSVFAALVKSPSDQVLDFLLNSEFMVSCLTAMKRGNGLTRTVSTFILKKILMDGRGVQFFCQEETTLYLVSPYKP